MPPTRVTTDDLKALRQRLYKGDQHVDAATARHLAAEIDVLREELAQARITFASKAAEALEKRLQVVAIYNHGGCPKCRDAEARAFLARLKKILASERSQDQRSR